MDNTADRNTILKRCFFNVCHQRKILKLNELDHSIVSAENKIVELWKNVNEIQPDPFVKFHRKGKFRYWFKEIDRLSTMNQYSVPQLCSKALSILNYSLIQLASDFGNSTKSSFNASQIALALLKSSKLTIHVNPCHKNSKPITCNMVNQYSTTDFAWSKLNSSSMMVVNKKRQLIELNVFEEEIKSSTNSTSPICCVKYSRENPCVFFTSGADLSIWDTRQESPVLSFDQVSSLCPRLSKHRAKSSCFVERVDESLLVASEKGELVTLDRRNPSKSVQMVETRLKQIFSIEKSANEESVILQSPNGKIKALDITSLRTVESGFVRPAVTKYNPTSGLVGGDQGVFVQSINKKLFLYCIPFKLSMLDMDLGGSVISTSYCHQSKQLFCSTINSGFIVSFH